MTRRAPARKVAHLSPYRLNNSPEGRSLAAARGFKWIDQDMRSHWNTHWPRPSRDRFLPRRDKRLIESLTSAEILALRSADGYQIDTITDAIRDAASKGLSVEIECKSEVVSAQWFLVLAAVCRLAYGPDWQARAEVKTLTTIPGWRLRLRHAHKAGFTTILLVRNDWRFRRIHGAGIDYVRGSRVMGNVARAKRAVARLRGAR
jgi:hypothetical protein